MADEQITVPSETLRHLFDLAVDTPLLCSGSFDSDDVDVLRRFAGVLGVDPAEITPDEFVAQFPHRFAPRQVRAEALAVSEWVKDSRVLAEHEFGARWVRRRETVEEQRDRMAEERADETCQAGPYDRRCGLLADDPKHLVPPHWTCADVTSIGQLPDGEWVCTDRCPSGTGQPTSATARCPTDVDSRAPG